MGQYGNQPDFGTGSRMIVPTGSAYSPQTGQNLKPSALYIGTGGTLVCTVVGGEDSGAYSGATIFYNIPNGTFFPVVVTNVWFDTESESETTTCSNIVALY